MDWGKVNLRGAFIRQDGKLILPVENRVIDISDVPEEVLQTVSADETGTATPPPMESFNRGATDARGTMDNAAQNRINEIIESMRAQTTTRAPVSLDSILNRGAYASDAPFTLPNVLGNAAPRTPAAPEAQPTMQELAGEIKGPRVWGTYAEGIPQQGHMESYDDPQFGTMIRMDLNSFQQYTAALVEHTGELARQMRAGMNAEKGVR